ncbi:MAG: class II glutamine amidotransferase [Thermoplasmata archaeon]
MCRMICGISNKDLILNPYLNELKYQAINGSHAPHEDGWGVLYSEGSALKLYKTKNSIDKDPESNEKFKNKIITDFFIMHARKGSVGERSDKNAHPFLYGGFGFCHNGTIKNASKLKVTGLEGGTDSEILFHYIVQQLKNGKEMKDAISKILSADLGAKSFNFMMGNKEELYVFRYANEKEEYYTIYESISDGTFMYSTEPFNSDHLLWQLLPNHILLHIRDMKKEVFQY